MADHAESGNPQTTRSDGRVTPTVEMIMRRLAKRYEHADPSRLVHFIETRTDALDGDGMAKVLKQLTEAIEKSPLSRYELSRRSGIPQSQLSGIVSGEKGISIANLERLCDVLGVSITLTRTKPKPKK